MRCCCSAVTHAGIDGLVLGGDAAARNNGWSRGMNDCRPAAKICGEEAGGSGRDARDSPGEAASCCRRSNSVSRRSPNAGDSGSWETSAGESPIGKPSLPRTFPPLGVTRLWGLEWQPAALRRGHERFAKSVSLSFVRRRLTIRRLTTVTRIVDWQRLWNLTHINMFNNEGLLSCQSGI